MSRFAVAKTPAIIHCYAPPRAAPSVFTMCIRRTTAMTRAVISIAIETAQPVPVADWPARNALVQTAAPKLLHQRSEDSSHVQKANESQKNQMSQNGRMKRNEPMKRIMERRRRRSQSEGTVRQTVCRKMHRRTKGGVAQRKWIDYTPAPRCTMNV